MVIWLSDICIPEFLGWHLFHLFTKYRYHHPYDHFKIKQYSCHFDKTFLLMTEIVHLRYVEAQITDKCDFISLLDQPCFIPTPHLKLKFLSNFFCKLFKLFVSY